MTDTHIHIHLNGETGSAAITPSKAASKPKKAASRPNPTPKPKRAASAYNKRYSAALKKVAPKYKKKNGTWKKDGFKKAVREAHRLAKK